MTKKMTAAQINSMGKKRRKMSQARESSLTTARLSKAMRKEAQQANKIVANSDVPRPCATYKKFVEATVKYCVRRRLAVERADPVPPLPGMVCPHHMTVGSSGLNRVLQRTHNLTQIHKRSYYLAARSHGAHWEKIVQGWDYFECKGETYKILEKTSQPTNLSVRHPWLVATPDFIVRLRASSGSEFFAILEVKSTTSNAAFKYVSPDYLRQVEAAMEVFGIDRGFLVMMKVDNNEKIQLQTKVLEVASNPIFNDLIKMKTAYADFLVAAAKELSLNSDGVNTVQMLAPFDYRGSLIFQPPVQTIALPDFKACNFTHHSLRRTKHLRRRHAKVNTGVLTDDPAYEVGGYHYVGKKNTFDK